MKSLLLAVLVAAAIVAALPVSSQTLAAAAATTTTTTEATPGAVASAHAALVQANYDDALAGGRSLQRSIAALTARPSAETLGAARQAWLAAREFYGQTEAFRFYGGPIDDAGNLEGRINAWPIDESYIDAVRGKTASGLVNDRRFAITPKSLAAQNERGGEENIATGWHAIEFLLWGQDTNDTGPGNRSADDFVDGKAPNADRRRQYLSVATELLVSDLARLSAAWAPGVKTNYRARFEAGGIESVRKIFVGLGSLSRGEAAGERLEVALNSQDQEDEHSCFSDNTHRDAVANAVGIENVWLGRYLRADGETVQGVGLRDLVAARDAALAERTTRQIVASVAAAKAIQPPFDREIIGAGDAPGRRRVQQAIDSLVQQSKDLVLAANAVGITRLTLVQP